MSDPPYRIRGGRGDDVTSAQRTQPCDPRDPVARRGDGVGISDTVATPDIGSSDASPRPSDPATLNDPVPSLRASLGCCFRSTTTEADRATR